MNKNKTLNNVLHAFINTLILKILPFILRTVILIYLGEKYLGLNNLFHSIITMLSIAELGFGSVLSYELYEPIANNNVKKVSQIINLYKKLYSIIGVVILILGIFIMPFLDKMIAGTYPKEVNIRIIYLIYLLETVVNFIFFTQDQALIVGNQRNDILSKTSTILNVIKDTLRIFLIVVFRNYYLNILCLPLGALIYRYIIHLIAKNKYSQFYIKSKYEDDLFKKVARSTTDLTIQKVFTAISSSIGNVIISSNIGLTYVTIYGNYTYISSTLYSIVSSILFVTTSTIGNRIVKESKEKNYIVFKMMSLICYWIGIWTSVCLVCLCQQFMIMWMGEKLTTDIYFVILLAINYFSSICIIPTSIYISANGMWRQEKRRVITTGLISIILQFVLAGKYGIKGLLVAQFVSGVLIGYPWIINIVFTEYFKINKKEYIKSLIKPIFVLIISSICCLYIASLISQSGILSFIIRGIWCFVLSNILFFIFYLNDNDMHMVLFYIGKELKSLKLMICLQKDKPKAEVDDKEPAISKETSK